MIDLIDERTKWVTVPGASNLLGSTPDLAPIIEAAHAVGANVYVDAVHLAPHRTDRHRRARLRRARHLAIQVVWPAQRRAVDATGLARHAAGVQGAPGRDHGPAGSRPACPTSRPSPASRPPPGS